jgi:ABC-type uncharacterized transport system fused permease/ATPase subunit
VKHGTIIKPGGSEAGLHQKVFFLPQKPYNVLGTLQEQLTYPAKTNIAMSRDELVKILDEVCKFSFSYSVSPGCWLTLCCGLIR